VSKNNQLTNNLQTNNNQQLQNLIDDYEFAKKNYQTKIQELNQQLSKIAGLSEQEAKQLLLENLDHDLVMYKAKAIKQAEASIKEQSLNIAQNLILEAMQSVVEDVVNDKTTVTLELEDESIKGRIIGKDGRNKRTFELLTGVDIIVEKTLHLTLSSTNAIRRELAKNVMVRLIKSKSIEPLRIQKVYEEEQLIFDAQLAEYARKVLEDELQIYDVDHNMYPIIGRLQLRNSYSQNAMSHAKECAKLAIEIARILKLDEYKAKKAAFFHDIGKAIDQEIDNDHVKQGINLAKEYHLEQYVIDAIASHHDGIISKDPYSVIVKIVDTISAARPGARINSYDEYIQRVKELESICLKHNGVKKAYGIKSGRSLIVIVDPGIIDEHDQVELGYLIKKEIQENVITNKFQIDIYMYRISNFQLKTETDINKQ